MGVGTDYEYINGKFVPKVYQPLPQDQYDLIMAYDKANANKSYAQQAAAYQDLQNRGLIPTIRGQMQLQASLKAMPPQSNQQAAARAKSIDLMNNAIANAQANPVNFNPAMIVTSKQGLLDAGKALSNPAAK